MTVFRLCMFLLAVICFAAAAFIGTPRTDNPRVNRVNLVALGLMFWALVPLITTIDSLD